MAFLLDYFAIFHIATRFVDSKWLFMTIPSNDIPGIAYNLPSKSIAVITVSVSPDSELFELNTSFTNKYLLFGT